MIPSIDYCRPKDLAEALHLLGKQPDTTKVIAGGTDIIIGLREDDKRFRDVRLLIDIHDLKELHSIEEMADGVYIGAGITFSDLIGNPLIAKDYPILAKAASTVGNVQIRNRATLAGNFINNAACADGVPSLLVYDARVRLRSRNKKREILLRDFLTTTYQTQKQPDEIVTHIFLPRVLPGYTGLFYKLGRRKGTAISRITLALLLKMYDKRIEDLRIASGAVTPMGMRFPELEAMALGQEMKSDFMKSLAQEFGKHILNKTGVRWSTAYKLPVVEQLFYTQLQLLADSSQGGQR